MRRRAACGIDAGALACALQVGLGMRSAEKESDAHRAVLELTLRKDNTEACVQAEPPTHAHTRVHTRAPRAHSRAHKSKHAHIHALRSACAPRATRSAVRLVAAFEDGTAARRVAGAGRRESEQDDVCAERRGRKARLGSGKGALHFALQVEVQSTVCSVRAPRGEVGGGGRSFEDRRAVCSGFV
eukprot:6179665-Pleurochrysis_carterae.AAC.1